MKHEATALNHPPAWALDAVAAGDAPGPIEPHLAECDACRQYVAELQREATEFRARADAKVFAAKVVARAADRPGPRRVWRALWVAAPALAAAVALVAWPSKAPPPVLVGPASSTGQHFKGGLTLAVIRERAGRQERLTAPFEVEPGDRIRVEVDVDRDQPVAAGLLSADGAWASLLSAVPLGPGTHYSELAARFDDGPTDAVLIVGAPDEVDRARRTRNFADVIAWPVRSATGR
jgi:hypothetical protein